MWNGVLLRDLSTGNVLGGIVKDCHSCDGSPNYNDSGVKVIGANRIRAQLLLSTSSGAL